MTRRCRGVAVAGLRSRADRRGDQTAQRRPSALRRQHVYLTAHVLSALALSACADRRLAAGPATAPTTATWTVVWAAAIGATIVAGVLLTLPAWQERGGARLAVAFLTVQAGAAAVAGTVLGAATVRSWQLIDRPVDDPAVAALLRLSRVDGDTAFFALILLFVVLGAGLLTTISALAARFAAGADPRERTIACALLAIELGAAGYTLVRFATGGRGWLYVTGTAAFPLLAVAFATCWPTRTEQPA